MPNKILYFNGCSWAEGAELDSLHNVKNKKYLLHKLKLRLIHTMPNWGNHQLIPF